MHARKFASCNGLDWTPTKGKFVPPEEDITNDNMEEFFVQCWVDGSKPNVTQGRRFINHILTHYGRALLNKHHRQNYASVLDVLKGLEHEKKWRDHQSQGAKPLPLEFVKKILLAKVHDDKGDLDLRKLRNKALASALILCGWHPKDAWEIKDKNVINLEDFHDRDGHHRPKFLFNGLHNKRQKWKVCNTIGCGCKRTHMPKNTACPYNLLLWYQQAKDEFDDRLRERKSKLCRKERLRHFDENGHLTDRKFFRSITKNGGCSSSELHEHRNMGQTAIRGVLEYWRPILGLGNERLTTDMARKTFCTLGKLCTGSNTNFHGALQAARPAAHGRHPPPQQRPVPDLRRQRGVSGPGVGGPRGADVLPVGAGPVQGAGDRVCARGARAHQREPGVRLRKHQAHADDHQLISK